MLLCCACRTTSAAAQQQYTGKDIAQLRAALQGEGVALGHQRQYQHHSNGTSLQQLRSQTLPAAAKPAEAKPAEPSRFDFSQVAARLQATQARVSSLGEKHGQIDAQRHLRLQGSISAGKQQRIPCLLASVLYECGCNLLLQVSKAVV